MRSLKKPIFGIIANSTSLANREELIAELGQPKGGCFAPLYFTFNGQPGEIIALDMQPTDIFSVTGTAKGQEAMLNAVDYFHRAGTRAVSFTASTKRLPGKNGQIVRSKYPSMTFTIGDNATMLAYLVLVDNVLSSVNFNPAYDNVVCLGNGFLGQKTVELMLKKGCRNITVVSEYHLSDSLDGSQVQIVDAWHKIPSEVKLFLSCTHKYRNQIDPLIFGDHLAEDAIIIDVAVPRGITPEVYAALSPSISRFDGGDFYLPGIKYNFPSSILSFPKVGFWYGCFTEAILLNLALANGENLEGYNFFDINDHCCNLVKQYLAGIDASVPLVNFYRPDDKFKTIPLPKMQMSVKVA